MYDPMYTYRMMLMHSYEESASRAAVQVSHLLGLYLSIKEVRHLGRVVSMGPEGYYFEPTTSFVKAVDRAENNVDELLSALGFTDEDEEEDILEHGGFAEGLAAEADRLHLWIKAMKT